MSDPASGVMHPLAPEHLPYFIPTAAGEDGMMGTATVFVLFFAFLAGTIYLRLHALPEQMAHGLNRTQMQLVAILALIALFTHESIFWIAALLLAAAQLPDFLTPITSGARSLATLSGRSYEGDFETPDEPHDQHATPDVPAPPPEAAAAATPKAGG